MFKVFDWISLLSEHIHVDLLSKMNSLKTLLLVLGVVASDLSLARSQITFNGLVKDT